MFVHETLSFREFATATTPAASMTLCWGIFSWYATIKLRIAPLMFLLQFLTDGNHADLSKIFGTDADAFAFLTCPEDADPPDDRIAGAFANATCHEDAGPTDGSIADAVAIATCPEDSDVATATVVGTGGLHFVNMRCQHEANILNTREAHVFFADS